MVWWGAYTNYTPAFPPTMRGKILLHSLPQLGGTESSIDPPPPLELLSLSNVVGGLNISTNKDNITYHFD